MNQNVIAAVLHLREASDLLKDVHPELSMVLLKTANAFVQTDEEMAQISEMERAAAEMRRRGFEVPDRDDADGKLQ